MATTLSFINSSTQKGQLIMKKKSLPIRTDVKAGFFATA
jgi:hypothetical protein